MKNMAWITGVLAGAMLLFAAAGCVLNAVYQIAIDENFYSGMSRAAVMEYLGIVDDPQAPRKVTEYIGLTDEEQKFFAETTRLYMLGEDQSIDLPVYVSKDEVRHMLDVRGLIWRARDLSRACLSIAAALAIVIAWTGAKLRHRILPKLAGMLGAIAVTGLAAACMFFAIESGGFAQMFTRMHELLFTNDLWLMDPAQHILIRMMPQPLFEHALSLGVALAVRMFAVVFVLLAAIDFVVGGMIRRHLAKEKE